ncbi:MAG: 1-deoxy-D-xylulose-5-phosphate reductoisomerase [Demequinaceae bacterium]|nr:1-deoxy-D-xylulose-5-phosphate reductoisomerase [Demequinaceae bacterium]
MGAARTVVVLGSTGSIGCQALDVIRRNPDRFTVLALAAGGGDLSLLTGQVREFKVRKVAVADDGAGGVLAETLPGVAVESGPDAAAWAAGLGADVVLNAMAGSAGLGPTLAALASGSTLALANKESLVAGGALVLQAKERPDQIVPVDSEHSAIAQALRAGSFGEVRRLILTASGGPFRGRPKADLAGVTREEALRHPTWSMGPVVTVNSATLMNKALEVIEAHLLFDIPLDRIDVVVHPESQIHSMVEFCDGSTIAQASPPDMRLPIALGLAWPDRVPGVTPGYDWSERREWTFEPLDEEAFPSVQLAREAVAASPLHPAVFNAANEEAVAAFLDGGLPFPGIVETVQGVMGAFEPGSEGPGLSLGAVLDAEAWARETARKAMGHLGTAEGSGT